jgi:hypothetical protein
VKYALFVGASDISDLLQYISKVITTSGRKVLLVDATIERFIFYGTPIPDKQMKLIDFENFDIATGYSTLSELKKSISDNLRYDHVIIHCDILGFLNRKDLSKIENKYVATTQEIWSIQKTAEVMESLFDGNEKESNNEFFTKIFVNNVETNIADNYLETILSNLHIGWCDEPFELLYDEIDFATKINNQHNGKLNIQKISKNYKNIIHHICKEITDLESKAIKMAMKNSMRRSKIWVK